jgi:putative SOS response-associated peptidase YedK
MMRPVHNRMPVILQPDSEAAWLAENASEDDLVPLLAPPPDDLLTARVVGDFVNDVRKDGPQLIEPREEQTALF